MFEFNVLKIGYFSRNRFWGELDTIAYRDPLCTTTLIKGNGKNIIVDPSAVCGDAVMTRDFFKAQIGYYNSVDFDRSKQSIAILAGMVFTII